MRSQRATGHSAPTRNWRLLFSFDALFALAVWAVLTIGGCKAAPMPGPFMGTGNAIAAADAYRQGALATADVPGVVRTLLGDKHQGKALVDASASLDAAVKEHQQVREDLLALEGRWYVRAGKWLTRTFWWLVGLYVGLGAVVIASGFLGGWWLTIGKEIVRLVPVCNPFSWIRDYVLTRRGQPVPVSAVASQKTPRRAK